VDHAGVTNSPTVTAVYQLILAGRSFDTFPKTCIQTSVDILCVSGWREYRLNLASMWEIFEFPPATVL